MATSRRIIDSFDEKELEIYDLLYELKNSDSGTKLTCDEFGEQYIKYNEQEDQFELDDDSKIGDDELDVVDYFKQALEEYKDSDWYLTD